MSIELVFKDLNFENKKEVLSFLGNKLYEHGYVDENYTSAIVQREQEYPTGLPAKVNIAIPHVDSDYVKKTQIAIGILNNEVMFNRMDNPSEELPVQLVIMLAIADSNGHIKMLQKIINFIQDEKSLKKIIESNDIEIVKNILNKNLKLGE